MPTRVELLTAFAAQRPEDPFPRYGLALEHKNAGRLDEAWGHFELLMAAHPDYTAGYLHAGNTLIALGRTNEARALFQRGIEVCARRGDAHAGGELQSALASLG
jgi:tetratricopeptide (TPR) repeat protein